MIAGEQDVHVNMGATIHVATDLTQVGWTSRLIVKEVKENLLLVSEISIALKFCNRVFVLCTYVVQYCF